MSTDRIITFKLNSAITSIRNDALSLAEAGKSNQVNSRLTNSLERAIAQSAVMLALAEEAILANNRDYSREVLPKVSKFAENLNQIAKSINC